MTSEIFFWDGKSILSFDQHIRQIGPQVQKIIELHQIASNLPDVFTDYKDVTKSLNLVVNAPCRVEVPIKPTQP
jgi:hypothetical protein